MSILNWCGENACRNSVLLGTLPFFYPKNTGFQAILPQPRKGPYQFVAASLVMVCHDLLCLYEGFGLVSVYRHLWQIHDVPKNNPQPFPYVPCHPNNGYRPVYDSEYIDRCDPISGTYQALMGPMCPLSPSCQR